VLIGFTGHPVESGHTVDLTSTHAGKPHTVTGCVADGDASVLALGAGPAVEAWLGSAMLWWHSRPFTNRLTLAA
jgi:hypothetical protein